MSKNKKLIRAKFRASVFSRDKYKCKMCGYIPNIDELDAHHITDRKEMPGEGYVLENGITLCPACHIKAEKFHETGESFPDYSPLDLYNAIGTGYDDALEASKKLGSLAGELK